MKIFFTYLFIFIFILNYSQELKHNVQSKETLYGISKKYNLTQEELITANPFLKNRGLKIGDQLIIPSKIEKKETNEIPVVIVNQLSNEFDYIEIKPQETIYNITKNFKISEETLKSLNPNLNDKGLKVGDIIRVPKDKKINPKGLHLVQAKETTYGISKKYQITPEDIYAVNPELQDGNLKVGNYIKIPEKSTIEKVEKGNFYHQVKSEETIFNILTKYDITLENLLKQNPELNNGLHNGMSIKIPVAKNAMNALKDNQFKNISDDYIDIVMFLPFDTKNKYSIWTEVASNFYLGSKLAIDSLTKKGKKINLRLVDSGDEFSLSSFLVKYDFSKTDMVIGPLRKEHILRVANFLKNTQIPIISPLSNSSELTSYKNIISCEPLPLYMGEKIAQEIINIYQNQKIYLVYDVTEEKLEAEDLKKYLSKTINPKQIIITRNVQDIKLNQDLLTNQTQGIIPVLISSNELLTTAFLNQIMNLNPDYIKPFSTYYHENYDNNVYKNFLRKTKLVYTIERKIDQNGNEEKNTLLKFNKKYCKQPDKYSIVGFDVTYDLINRFIGNNKLNLDFTSTQLGTKFEFIQQNSLGAYFNKGFRLVKMQE